MEKCTPIYDVRGFQEARLHLMHPYVTWFMLHYTLINPFHLNIKTHSICSLIPTIKEGWFKTQINLKKQQTTSYKGLNKHETSVPNKDNGEVTDRHQTYT
jgi:hypothetical protein